MLFNSQISKITSGGGIYQDQDGYLVLAEDGSTSIQVDALNVTTNGTYTASSGHAYSPVTVNVSGGGGVRMSDPIRFFDYDGTLVASYSSVPSSLPSVPTHTGLTNGTWNHTLQQVTAQFNAMGTCDVGANYETSSGKTEIDVTFVDSARLSPYLRLAVNGTATIDWGDGSATSTATSTSLTSRQNVQHTYASTGSYTITISPTSGTYAMYGTDAYPLLHADASTYSSNLVYSNCVKAVRVGSSCVIGNYAFAHCYMLSKISVPSDLSTIGQAAFKDCGGLVFFAFPSDITATNANVFENCYTLKNVSFPTGLTSIGTYVFSYCALNSVSLPSGLTVIGTYAFRGCRGLSSINIPSTVTSISTAAFQTCSTLSSINIPSTITSFGSNAFSNCEALTNVNIPSNLTSFGTGTFSNCYRLASASIPSDVTAIPDSTFSSCRGLTSINIPSGVTSIGNSSFYSCYSLASITIPSTVTSIGTSAFSSCPGVLEYHIKPTSPPTLANVNAFNGISSDCVMYVPSASLNDYKTADIWSTWESQMVGE